VEQIGSEHILFGTDSYAAGFQRGRIEYALISDEAKMNILRNNALNLFRNQLTEVL
jgi:predicted TIM-barrel fold metal-dependent hydrolase